MSVRSILLKCINTDFILSIVSIGVMYRNNTTNKYRGGFERFLSKCVEGLTVLSAFQERGAVHVGATVELAR